MVDKNALMELALDLSWSWKHHADALWQELEPELWDLTHNPWVVLQTASPDKLKRLLADPACKDLIEKLIERKRCEASTTTWFQQTYPAAPISCIAYFCMEFMLSEALPIYSGGLGNVAGDQLKSASDLGVPVIGIGLLYQQGYFRQVIDQDGSQQALYPYNDPTQLPVRPLRRPDGEWLRLEIKLPGWSLWLRVWQVQVGRVKLLLLDSNDPANFPAHRGITSELYGGGIELRLQQELVLGIGGWRIFEALGIKPEVCHLNEGHAAFAVLDRAASFMKESGVSFEVALTATRAGNLFTTHTAVSAAFDRFPQALIAQYLGSYAQNTLGITIPDLMALGRKDPRDSSEPFNMAYFALHSCGAVNGVSRLHGKVSRSLFAPLFPRWPIAEVPIKHVTNGVHMSSWDSEASDSLWTTACGKSRWLGTTEELSKEIRSLSDEKLWKMRCDARGALIDYSRNRLAKQLEQRGAPEGELEAARTLFDPNTLTVGFARRFATYKRPNMLLHNPDRLLSLLCNPKRPIQLILAGKAHPADLPGQAMIREWMQFIRRPEARAHVIFLSDYDILVTEQLVQGVDVWLNTPKRPWEACGTSGMKVLVNGGINVSELDGWWDEAYAPDVGWALGNRAENSNDAAEANELYDLLEKQVAPQFYARDEEGLPIAWIKMMRESMARLTPQFSANRAVREYVDTYYVSAAKHYQERAQDRAFKAKQIVEWKKTIQKHWPFLRFSDLKIETKENQHHFDVQIYLDGLNPNDIRAELYAEGLNNGLPECYEMSCIRQLAGTSHMYHYKVSIPSKRQAADFTPRVVPSFPEVSLPLETNQILWHS